MTYLRKGRKKAQQGNGKPGSSSWKSKPTWTFPWMNQVSRIPDEMLPEKIAERRPALERLALVPGRKVRAVSLKGKKHLGLFSRIDAKSASFFMKGSRDRFDPRGVEVEIQKDDLVTFVGKRPIYLVESVEKGMATLAGEKEKVPVEKLVFVRTLTSGYVPGKAAEEDHEE